MAYADDVTLQNVAGATVTFSRQALDLSGARCTWIDTASTNVEPRTMRIAHRAESIPGLTGQTRDRHTVDFTVVKKDATTGLLFPASVSVSVLLPRSGVVTRAMLDDLIYFVGRATPNGFVMTAANIDKLLRSEL